MKCFLMKAKLILILTLFLISIKDIQSEIPNRAKQLYKEVKGDQTKEPANQFITNQPKEQVKGSQTHKLKVQPKGEAITHVDSFIRFFNKNFPVRECLALLCKIKKIKTNTENKNNFAQILKTKFNEGLKYAKEECKDEKYTQFNKIIQSKSKSIKKVKLCMNLQNESIEMFQNHSTNICSHKEKVIKALENLDYKEYGRYAVPLYFIITKFDFDSFIEDLSCSKSKVGDISNYKNDD